MGSTSVARLLLLRFIPPILRPHSAAIPNSERAELFERRLVLTRYVRSLLPGRKDRHLYDGVRYYCMFIGWPRSGHSLFGSILDAHPNFVISHELDALPLVDGGFSRDQLFWSIIENSQAFAQKGRGWSGYSYAVPNQWQGRYEHLHVVGDKKGGRSTSYLSFVNPEAIDKLRKTVRVPIRVILYHRNPFDVLATLARRWGQQTVPSDLVKNIFRHVVPTVGRIRSELSPEERIEIHHEEFVTAPREVISQTVQRFGEIASSNYLDDIKSIVVPNPNRSRGKIVWDSETVRIVENESSKYEFLKQYSLSA